MKDEKYLKLWIVIDSNGFIHSETSTFKKCEQIKNELIKVGYESIKITKTYCKNAIYNLQYADYKCKITKKFCYGIENCNVNP